MRPLSERAFDALCVGEALVDFLPDRKGRRLRDVEVWTRCPGGSPANVAIGVSRLSGRSAFLGVVGEDELGYFLRERLIAEGVDVRGLRHSAEARTGIVFVSLDETGERSFTDYRKPSAELLLAPEDAAAADVEQTRILHLTTSSLLRPEAQQAAATLMRQARERGCLVTCDPNMRPSFWGDDAGLRRALDLLLPLADVIKLAEDELALCTGERDPARGAQALIERGAKLGIVTRGARGALWARGGKVFEQPSPKAAVVDQTGAGDGFDAGLITWLGREMREGKRLEDLSDAQVAEAMRFACEVGAAVVTRLGAVAGLPRLERLPARQS
ncbi:MAG: carbohydrate kinase family protein [Myxococcales bacterium]|jgi:fructokinase